MSMLSLRTSATRSARIADGRHGPLPPLLLSMTLVTGLVDAFSYLALGHVFVANMTGNVVFLGFALAGVPGFSVLASLAAVASFAPEPCSAAWLASRYRDHRGRLHSSAAVTRPSSWRSPSSWPPAAAR